MHTVYRHGDDNALFSPETILYEEIFLPQVWTGEVAAGTHCLSAVTLTATTVSRLSIATIHHYDSTSFANSAVTGNMAGLTCTVFEHAHPPRP